MCSKVGDYLFLGDFVRSDPGFQPGAANLAGACRGRLSPAHHFSGVDFIEMRGREAGRKLLDLARDGGYRLGKVGYWRDKAPIT